MSESNPPDVFDESALNTVGQFKHSPDHVNGKLTSSDGVHARIVSELQDEEGKRPERALEVRSPNRQPSGPKSLPPKIAL